MIIKKTFFILESTGHAKFKLLLLSTPTLVKRKGLIINHTKIRDMIETQRSPFLQNQKFTTAFLNETKFVSSSVATHSE